jgi:hypothetical protein
LLLAHGDPEAKKLLRHAIEARYGTRPPVLDSLRIDFNGRARVKVGPLGTWVPVDTTAYFHFPTSMRLDFTVRPLKLPVQHGIEAFDGTTCRSSRGDKEPTILTDEEHVYSMRRRLWAVAATLLTPLGDQTVKLSAQGENKFEALNTQLEDSALITLREDGTLEQVRVECLNPANNQHQQYTIYLSENVTNVNEVILPAKIAIHWDDEPHYELEPIRAVSNPDIPSARFTLSEGDAGFKDSAGASALL